MPQFRPLSETKFINDANLVAYYKLEDVSDETANNYDLTNNNSVAFNAAKYGNGADFGSSNSSKYLTIASNLGIVGGACSISLWANITTAPANGVVQYFAAVIDGGTKTGPAIYYYNNAGTYSVDFRRKKPGIADQGISAIKTLTPGNWYHLVFVYDGTNVSGYIDGVFQGSAAASGNGSLFSSGTTIGGLSQSLPGNYLSGLVDDIAVFNRALSASEVNELYQGMTLGEQIGSGSGVTKLLLHLNGNNYDYSGNGNVGTDSNVSYVTGKFGKCASYTGASNSYSAYTPANLPLAATARYMSCWFNTSDTTARHRAFLSYGTASGGKPIYFLDLNSAHKLYTESGSGADAMTSANAVNDGKWHKASLNYDGTTLTMYLDGVEVNHATTTLTTESSAFWVGGMVWETSLNFIGLVDEVILDNVSHSATQEKKEYTYQRGMFGII